jgi:sec-independent protein translocase protein TatB
MFDIGFWELVFLFGLGLMVLGPERMPQVAAKLGRWAGQARVMARNLTNQIRDEIEPVQSQVDSIQESVNKSMSETLDQTIDESGQVKPRKDWSKLRPEPGEATTEQDTDKGS